MNSYFFKMTKEEKENILDAHKSIYDGFVTEYGKNTNKTPLYVQDLANDKNGITVSNKGDVKTHTNVKINEDFDGRDKIADGPHDLKNGTVDFRGTPDMSDVNRKYFHDDYPSPNENENEYISVGFFDDMEGDGEDDILDKLDVDDDFKDRSMYSPYYDDENTEDVIDIEDDYNIFLELEEEDRDEVTKKVNESLDMFSRFKKYY